MAFEIPSIDDEHENALALHRALLPEMDTSEFSHENKWAFTQAGAVFGNNVHVSTVKNDVMPDTAKGDMADRWGNLRGVPRKTESPARKAAALRVVGVAGTSVPDATRFTHVASGLRFRTVGTKVVSSTGSVDVDVIGVDTGSKTRLNAGEVLTLDTGIANLEDDAELQLALDEGGDDAELDDTYVPRYLLRFSNPPLGGTQSDFEKFATDQPGIARARAYPGRNGVGTVDVAALHAGSGAFRVLTEPERAALFAAMSLKRPVAMRGFRVLTVVTQAVDVEATIFDDGAIASAFDWDDATPPTCLTFTALTRVLQFTGGTRPATLQPNDRITISNGATGRERVVEALSGADSVVLEADGAGDVPAPGSIIYAGGPLVQPARIAVQALFDSIDTANPDTHRYGTWEGNLRPTALSRAITGVAGVLDLGELVTPVATVVASDPEFPDNATVGLLIPGRILIRKAAP